MYYLSRVKFGQYKSINGLDLKLNPGLNIIIGPNGSGKTNLLELIEIILSFSIGDFFSDVDYELKLSLEAVNSDQMEPIKIELDATVNRNQENFIPPQSLNSNLKNFLLEVNYEITFFKGNEKLNELKGTANVNSLISKILHGISQNLKGYSYSFYFFRHSIYTAEPTLGIPGTGEIKLLPPNNTYIGKRNNYLISSIFSTGSFLDIAQEYFESNPPSETQFLSSPKVNAFLTNLSDTLSTITSISGLRLSESLRFYANNGTIKIENIQFEFLVDGTWFHWNELSDGTKRMFLIITELTLAPEDTIFLIEEPELGIHPHQLHLLMDFIREEARRKQIVLTTHSPQILNVLVKNELDHIILTEMVGGQSKFRHLTAKENEKAIYYMENEAFLSDYWQYSDLETID